jgi:hypothetical protein
MTPVWAKADVAPSEARIVSHKLIVQKIVNNLMATGKQWASIRGAISIPFIFSFQSNPVGVNFRQAYSLLF